jgi:hypothetical protein
LSEGSARSPSHCQHLVQSHTSYQHDSLFSAEQSASPPVPGYCAVEIHISYLHQSQFSQTGISPLFTVYILHSSDQTLYILVHGSRFWRGGIRPRLRAYLLKTSNADRPSTWVTVSTKRNKFILQGLFSSQFGSRCLIHIGHCSHKKVPVHVSVPAFFTVQIQTSYPHK